MPRFTRLRVEAELVVMSGYQCTALYHPFQRNQRRNRLGETPAELLTGYSNPHWLELLGLTRFKRAAAAT